MLPITCSHDPCRNIDVKKGSTTSSSEYLGDPASNAARCEGTIPNWPSRRLKLRRSSVASKKKISRFNPIRKLFTHGALYRGWSSLIGSIRKSGNLVIERVSHCAIEIENSKAFQSPDDPITQSLNSSSPTYQISP